MHSQLDNRVRKAQRSDGFAHLPRPFQPPGLTAMTADGAMNAQLLYQQAVALHQQRRLAEAEPLYLQVLAAAPANFSARYMFALLRFQQQRAPEALAAVDAALGLNPRSPDALMLQGTLLLAAGRAGEALTSFDTAAALKPGDASIWFNRGMVLQRLGRIDEALASHEQAVARQPDYAEAWYQRGGLLQYAGRLQEALLCFDRAVAANLRHAGAWNDRGTVLLDLERPEEALASLDRALALDPERAEIWYNRGRAMRELIRVDDALKAYDRALELNPGLAAALINRSTMRLKEKRDYAGALADLERFIQITPDHPYAAGRLLHLKMQGADWRDFDADVAAITDGVRAGKPVVQPFVYQAITNSPADFLSCSVQYANHLYPPLPALSLKDHRGHRKIRLGYMSGEMGAHATGFLMAGVFEHHDKDRFELVILDNGRDDGSATRKRIEAAAGKLIDITRLRDQAVADRIRDEEIDILVNLNGYFGSVRMEIFAGRPAPIQVNYLGFPGTLGASYIDYIVADRIIIPDDERQFYTEQVVHMAETYWPTDNRQAVAQDIPSRAQCGLPEAGFVFCNFNQSYKITPAMFDVWARILQRTEGSVLWLLDDCDGFAPNLRREAQARGVSGERLIFAPPVANDLHLARIKQADLSLDCLPCNGHTTTCDTLWAGVPLLTCTGSTFTGRVAASLLQAVGMPELICENLGAYEDMAVTLAQDSARLKALRQKLDQNRRTWPLFDTARFTRNLEAAYSQMWKGWLAGKKPSALAMTSAKVEDL